MISKSRVSPPPAPRPSTPKTGLSPFAIVIIAVVLVTAAVLGLRNAVTPKPSPVSDIPVTATSTEDIQALVDQVGSLIMIKRDESPTVATIEDAELLRSQNPQFYKDAANGDRLLIWSDKAVLYSSNKNIILAVIPVNLPVGGASSTSATATTSTQESQKETAVIEVRNGSGTVGLGRVMADKLKAAGLDVLPATDAKVKTYEKTVIVKANDKALPVTLQTLIGVTGASVVAAPEAEGTIKGDFLVIVGADASN